MSKEIVMSKAPEFKRSGSPELQNAYITLAAERRDGAPQAESRSPDFFITQK